VQSTGEFLAVVGARMHLGAAAGHADLFLGQEIQQMGKQGHVLPITNLFARIPIIQMAAKVGVS
jgi:hypothetical protein